MPSGDIFLFIIGERRAKALSSTPSADLELFRELLKNHSGTEGTDHTNSYCFSNRKKKLERIGCALKLKSTISDNSNIFA
jgi:hypothetical protein